MPSLKDFNPRKLAQLLYDTPDRTKKTIRRIADEMGGIDERYLSRQLNPDDSGAKVGVEDFVYLLSVTDLAPLDMIERSFGRIAVEIPANFGLEKKTWLKHVSDISIATGVCVGSFLDAIADDRLSDAEREECTAKIYQAIRALASLYQELNRNPQRDPPPGNPDG